MKKIWIVSYVVVLGLVVACSKQQGELVEKSGDQPTPVSMTQSELPAGHPPTSGMGGGRGTGRTALSPGPAQEPLVVGNQATVASLTFQIDPSWISEKPKSSMRAAQFRLPAPEGEEGAGELVIFQGMMGPTDANLQRWIGQFQQRNAEPVMSEQKVEGFTVHTLDVSGTFTGSGMMGGGTAQENFRMLAAIIEGHPKGPWYFKLTGPQKVIAHWKQAFDEMILSMKPQE